MVMIVVVMMMTMAMMIMSVTVARDAGGAGIRSFVLKLRDPRLPDAPLQCLASKKQRSRSAETTRKSDVAHHHRHVEMREQRHEPKDHAHKWHKAQQTE